VVSIKQVVSCCAFVLLVLCLPRLLYRDLEPFVGFDRYVEYGMAKTHCPGLAIAIVKDNAIVFAKGYGVRKIGTDDKVDAHTIFQIASVSKQFTAALCGILVDEGKLEWDEKVTHYLPWFKLQDAWVTEHLTLRDLLLHRCGLPPTNWQWYASPMKSHEILERLQYQPLTVGFRQKHMYQNVGYLLAGTCAAAAGRGSFEDLLRRKIFEPLHMNETGTSTKALSELKNVAFPHMYIGDKQVVVPYRNLDQIVPAGGITSNVLDLAQWLKCEIAGGKCDGRQIISKQSLDEMARYQIAVEPSATLLAAMPHETKFLGYGMGLYTHNLFGHQVLRHSGGIEGFATTCGYIPDKQVGIVILTNGDSACCMGVFYRLCEFYMGLSGHDWISRISRAYAATDGKWVHDHPLEKLAKRLAGTKPTHPLEDYCGKYESKVYGSMRIFLDKRRRCLSMDFGPERTGMLEHHHFDTFRIAWRQVFADGPPQLLIFTLDADKNITGLELDDVARFTKVPDDEF
jgi:CubicO group peptidase (beta-lactamase class C family)